MQHTQNLIWFLTGLLLSYAVFEFVIVICRYKTLRFGVLMMMMSIQS